MTWRGDEPTAASDRDPACLTVFAIVKAAQTWLESSPAQRLEELANQELDVLFPGFSYHNQQQIFCDWPSERWTRCCYSAPSQGQVTRVFPLLQSGWQTSCSSPGSTPAPASTATWKGD